MADFPKYSTFFNLHKTPKFLKIELKLQMSKLEKPFSISEVFEYYTFGQDVLHYIHEENLRLEQKRVNRDNILQVGKLRLHKLCQNKDFSTAGTMSPNSKRKIFSCSPSIILFNY